MTVLVEVQRHGVPGFRRSGIMASQTRTLDEGDQLVSLNNEVLPPGVTKLDAVGGPGGDGEYGQALGYPFRIREVRIGSKEVIDSLQPFVYVDPVHSLIELAKYGGGGGTIEHLDVPLGEYIGSVDVRYGKYIDGLTFTILGGGVPRYAHFGGSGGNHSKTLSAGRLEEICGFHGKAGEFIDSIGVYIRPRQ
jgi:Jacalin-like lectin domain